MEQVSNSKLWRKKYIAKLKARCHLDLLVPRAWYQVEFMVVLDRGSVGDKKTFACKYYDMIYKTQD